MILVEESRLITNSISELIQQLSKKEFSMPLPILSHGSISQHIRHILEFFQEFIFGLKRGEIDFDQRKRSKQLEENPEFALEMIGFIQKELVEGFVDIPISIRVSTHDKNERPLLASTSLRELAYCNEHAVHHLAIIKIALSTTFPDIIVGDGFGIAYSTQQVSR
ncbi:DinB family protein [Leptospira paudalimensis]|uniref:DinB family protein n=1 Tax=Leptospira paudalimensis TaxID=2950024 RepID=A0ABT3M854_9LEPT|nr:DinB family protein [Leptospira paudalimensis]MCW7504569.1 DinB family protein [Leptospira paudalimensis]